MWFWRYEFGGRHEAMQMTQFANGDFSAADRLIRIFGPG
jgi:hypothetical protein